jgi:hypothetical protein
MAFLNFIQGTLFFCISQNSNMSTSHQPISVVGLRMGRGGGVNK